MPIFDQGYQHWQGTLGGHGWRWLAVTRHGVRVGMQNRILRFLIIVAWIPAVALAGVISLWGLVEQKAPWAMSLLASIFPVREFLDNPAAYRVTMWTYSFYFFIHTEIFFVMILVLMVGPSLISQDLRFNALPLYFSRPVRRFDYFLGKMGVIGFFLSMVTVIPAIAAWVLGVLFSLDFSVIFDTVRILFGVILYGFIVTLSAGSLILALSSLTRNSRYVGAIWAGLWLLTFFIYGLLEGLHYDHVFRRQNALHHQGFQNQRRLNDGRNLGVPPDRRDEMVEATQRLQRELEEEFRYDWRPCVSYMHDLTRFGDALLGYYDAQDRYYELAARAREVQNGFGGPGGQNEPHIRFERLEPRWPWYWSGIVLVALGGLSVWSLNARVKNLDRLR